MATVDKRKLARALASELELPTPLTQAQARAAIDLIVHHIVTAVSKGDKVAIMGFGSFESKPRAQRIGRQPGTRIPINIPARNVPVFTPYDRFREEVLNLPLSTVDAS